MTGNDIVTGAEPIRLDAAGDRGVLLLHGFNDTPQSLAELARALHARGWSVSVPLLPQHGRAQETLVRDGNSADWMAFSRSEWNAFRARVPRAVIGGQSMGGAIAALLAAETPPAALVLLAPYLSMGGLTQLVSMIWPAWQLVTPRLHANAEAGIRDPAARALSLGGGEFTPRLVAELRRVVKAARRSLGAVQVPTLYIQGRHDYRIPAAAAARSFGLLGASDKTLVWRDVGGHVLAVDTGREEVFSIVGDWLDAHFVTVLRTS